MQHQNLAMLEANFAQRLVNGRRIRFGKRRFIRFSKVLILHFFGLLAGVVAADAIHRDSMRDRIEPRSQGAGVSQLSDAAKNPDPHLLQNVERTVLVAGQTRRVVKQQPLHDCNQILECTWPISLAAKRYPLVLCPILVLHMHSLLMSKGKSSWFNLPGRIFFLQKQSSLREAFATRSSSTE